MFFDTHAHYDDSRYDADRDELLGLMRGSGVGLILNAGAGITESRHGLALAERYPFMYCSVGVHPHEAESMDGNSLNELRDMLRRPKAVAVGEIGLDYHYDNSPRELQKLRFYEQMELCREVQKPVIIHEREAFSDVMSIVRDFPGIPGVFHCFSGGWDAAKSVLDMGWMLSFTGVITFKSARASLDVASRVPLDRLMLETDAPYLSPEPKRGTRND
ncbi:MAG: TatD family hydrolase, partial [Oscillospiraceae bacterium]|nr:TatD family hydrolase [Oscillospiraceae bacterium]